MTDPEGRWPRSAGGSRRHRDPDDDSLDGVTQHGNARRPVSEWDWRAIYAQAAEARERLAKMPRCEVCGHILALGQKGRHRVCEPTPQV